MLSEGGGWLGEFFNSLLLWNSNLHFLEFRTKQLIEDDEPVFLAPSVDELATRFDIVLTKFKEQERKFFLQLIISY